MVLIGYAAQTSTPRAIVAKAGIRPDLGMGRRIPAIAEMAFFIVWGKYLIKLIVAFAHMHRALSAIYLVANDRFDFQEEPPGCLACACCRRRIPRLAAS